MSGADEPLGYAAALALGLLGNVHCIAMCGGIVAAFSGSPPAGATSARAALVRPLPYNVGRISSYAVAGAVAGAAGLILAASLGATGLLVLRGLFALTMIAAGLHLAGFVSLLGFVERAAAPLWRRLSRAVAWLRPADRFWKAWLLGAIWGWLPCGLVYAALIGAATSGSAERGALLMICFGVGTLPALLAAGALAARLRGTLARSRVRAAAGLAVGLFGVWTLAGAALGYVHFGHAAAADSKAAAHAGHAAH